MTEMPGIGPSVPPSGADCLPCARALRDRLPRPLPDMRGRTASCSLRLHLS